MASADLNPQAVEVVHEFIAQANGRQINLFCGWCFRHLVISVDIVDTSPPELKRIENRRFNTLYSVPPGAPAGASERCQRLRICHGNGPSRCFGESERTAGTPGASSAPTGRSERVKNSRSPDPAEGDLDENLKAEEVGGSQRKGKLDNLPCTFSGTKMRPFLMRRNHAILLTARQFTQ